MMGKIKIPFKWLIKKSNSKIFSATVPFQVLNKLILIPTITKNREMKIMMMRGNLPKTILRTPSTKSIT